MAVYGHQIGKIAETGTSFFDDVKEGLQADPKRLPSKYFYDKEGDRLFQKIMQLPEYYPTKCELDIFMHGDFQRLIDSMSALQHVDVVELGAGDASKTKHLLKKFQEQNVAFTYYPIDISDSIIRHLEKTLPGEINGIEMVGLNGEYFEMLEEVYRLSSNPKLVLFLGGNIGNFETEETSSFIKELYGILNSGDQLLVGFDLKKNPQTILNAYNDAAGVTKAFNLNLLRRMNRELNADFQLDQFEHFPTYDPLTGSCRSYLVSTKRQVVCIGDELKIEFGENESVYVEISQKYTVQEIEQLFTTYGFRPKEFYFDSKQWFTDVLVQKG